MIDPKLRIESIESLVMSMQGLNSRERWKTYATIRDLTEDLVILAKSRGRWHGRAREEVTNFLRGVERLADLPGGHDEAWRQREAMMALDLLRRPGLFQDREGSRII
jgi:hypothetical protein